MIEIRRLVPERIEDYIRFHEGMDFTHAPQWKGCYCHFYHSEKPAVSWDEKRILENKMEVIRKIDDRVMTGFLAYENRDVVGWLNANDLSICVRLGNGFQERFRNQRIAIAICFMVHPDYRRQGIARRMLDEAVRYYKSEGYDGIIGLPAQDHTQSVKHYHGSYAMFKEQGFQYLEHIGDASLVFKSLR